MFPFEEKTINENTVLREFKNTSVTDEQMWHRDAENRTVIVLESGGWSFQTDDALPVALNEGDEIFIPKETWHRVIQGEGVLKVKVIKETLEESEFSYMVAQAAMDGKKEVKIGDKTYPVKMSKDKAKKILDEKDEVVEESDNPHPKQYKAPQGSKRDKSLDKAKELYKKGDIEGAVRAREKEEKRQRKIGVKSKPRKDTGKWTSKNEAERIDEGLRLLVRGMLLEKKKKRKSSGGSLSAATKATLKKKAEKRGLTPGSVYAEFRKGLAAWLSSGSRKGMSQHQWAHARVNSATPSKSWAVVKKSKAKKKKKKKK